MVELREISVALMEHRLLALPKEIWDAEQVAISLKSEIENQENKISGIEGRAIKQAISQVKSGNTAVVLARAIAADQTEVMKEKLVVAKANYQHAMADLEKLRNEHLSLRKIATIKNQT